MAVKMLIDQLPIAIPSMCLGRAAHYELEPKLQAVTKAGFKGIEVPLRRHQNPSQKVYGINFIDLRTIPP
jgi:sugar phosphate isomerase/epimerase